jgi:iron complex outermembrane receptor protein
MRFHKSRSAGALLATAAVAIFTSMPAVGQDFAPMRDDQEQERKRSEIVTGQSLAIGTLTPQPVKLLSGAEIVHRRQGGLGETLAGLPGIHLDNFGGGASRPVIRGQTVDRRSSRTPFLRGTNI